MREMLNNPLTNSLRNRYSLQQKSFYQVTNGQQPILTTGRINTTLESTESPTYQNGWAALLRGTLTSPGSAAKHPEIQSPSLNAVRILESPKKQAETFGGNEHETLRSTAGFQKPEQQPIFTESPEELNLRQARMYENKPNSFVEMTPSSLRIVGKKPVRNLESSLR